MSAPGTAKTKRNRRQKNYPKPLGVFDEDLWLLKEEFLTKLALLKVYVDIHAAFIAKRKP